MLVVVRSREMAQEALAAEVVVQDKQAVAVIIEALDLVYCKKVAEATA
jgi:hypothetical protein